MKKVCPICKKSKDCSEFYPDKRMKDGLYAKCKKCHLKYNKKWISKNPGYMGKKHKEWRKRNWKQWKANVKFEKAVWKGKIIRKPCEVCGSLKAQGHHKDYNKPFNVMWLCKKHHAEEHARLKSLENLLT